MESSRSPILIPRQITWKFALWKVATVLVSLGVKLSLRFEKVKSYLVTPKFGLKVGGFLKTKEKVKRRGSSIQYPLPNP